MVDSPEYDCQSALHVKLQAVLNARCQLQFGRFCGLSGSHCWVINMTMIVTNPNAVMLITDPRYRSHDISSPGLTPLRR